jgi:glycosyltransferase involved in cell wall biosynthesis
MKYTIITINYNNKDGLRQTIKSVIEQSFKGFEFIIIDGGSTDGSLDVLKEYNKKITYWISEPDNGVYNAMNKGIAKAHGDYINFMNSGDCFYDRNVLANITEQHLSEDLIVGRDYHYNAETKKGFATILPPRLSMLTFIHHTLPHQSSFFKRELFDHNLYDEKLQIVADLKFYINQICVKGCSVKLIDIIVCRREPDGISWTYNDKRMQEHSRVIQEILPSGAIKDYETLYMLDKETMYKLMHLIENGKSRKWLTYFIKFLNRLTK